MVNLTAEANSEVDAGGIPNDTYESDLEIAEDALMNQAYVLHNNSGFHRLTIWLSKKYEELVDDFSEVRTVIQLPDTEGEQLNPLKLKRNLVRFGNFIDVFEEFLKSFVSITRWQNPAVSFMAFTIYMVVIYKDWLLPTISFGIVSAFLTTYLRHKGWSFGNEVTNSTIHPSIDIEKDLGMKDQFSIIIITGRRAQNLAGVGSDILEKMRNILLWREPELTQPVVILFAVVFIAALLFPAYFLVKMAGLALGVYMFVIQYCFARFPRVDKKYNIIVQFLSQLKTDAQYEMEINKIKKNVHKTQKLSRSVSAMQINSSLTITPTGSLSPVTTLETSFHDTFQLPITEIVLSAWKNGRRCFLVNKEKYFSVGYKIGRMYLTKNYLCFQKSKTENCKTVVVPLETIHKISKAKLYQWAPGGGKAIEITIKDTRKALLFVFQVNIFGPIISRDEAFDSIMAVGSTNEYTWAKPR